MKIRIERVVREHHPPRLMIKGWAETQDGNPVPNIFVKKTENIESFHLYRTKKLDSSLQDQRKTGFVMEIVLKRLSGTVEVVFKHGKTLRRKSFDLDKRYCSPQEPGSLRYVLREKAEDARSRISPQFSQVLLMQMINKLPRPVYDHLKTIRGKLVDLKNGGMTEYEQWIKTVENSTPRDLAQLEIEAFSLKPKISILVPVYNVKTTYLKAMIDSVLNQFYENWELILVDDCSNDEELLSYLKTLKGFDPRIKICFREKNGNISRASNTALSLADGDFIGLLDHDDELTPDALFEVVKYLNEHPNADFIYSDEDKIDENGKRVQAHFKSDFAPDSLLSNNYICHFSVLKKSLVDAVGGFEERLEGAQDHDLFLKLTEHAEHIGHIPKILYHWRILEGSTAKAIDEKSYADQAGLKAVKNALNRRGLNGNVSYGRAPGSFQVDYLVEENPKIAIIIPTKDNAQILKRCIESIYEKSSYPNFEILIVDNGSRDSNTLTYLEQLRQEEKMVNVLRMDIPFNFSVLNNEAVKHTDAEYLLFLNDDTEAKSDGFLESMLGYAALPHAGAVGAKLLYPDGSIQHAGIVLGLGNSEIAGHVYARRDADFLGYYGTLQNAVNYSAVTAACLMIEKKKFEQVGGFDESLPANYNDVDLCLKLADEGFFNIYDPYAVLIHYESLSRGLDFSRRKREQTQKDRIKMYERWMDQLTNDPMYNPNLSLEHAFKLKQKS